MWSAIGYRHSANTFGDGALLGLDLDALTSHPVLTGSYSRFSFHHPGPMYAYLLAPFWWLSRGAWSAHFASGLLNTIWVAIGIWASGRIDAGRGRFVAAVGFAVLIASLPPAITLESWNPSVSLLGASAFLVLLWSHVMRPSRPTLATALFLGSFLAQVHVTLGPILVLAAGFVACVRAVQRWNERGSDRRISVDGDTVTVASAPVADTTSRAKGFGRIAAWCAFVTILWLPPLIDLLTNNPNNLATILRKTDELPHPHSLGDVLPIALGQLARPVGFLLGAGTDPQSGARGVLPKVVTLLLLSLVSLAAWRRRDRGTLLGVGIIAATCVGMVASLSRVVDAPIPYYLGRFGGAALTVLLLAVLGRFIVSNMPFTASFLAVAMVVLLCVASLHSARDISRVRGATEFHAEVEALPEQLHDGDALGLGDVSSQLAFAGIIYEARLNGIHIRASTNSEVLSADPINTTIVLFRPWDRTAKAPDYLLRTTSKASPDERVIATINGVTLTKLLRVPMKRVGG